MGPVSADVIEVVLGDHVLRLDGTVVEVLHRTGLFHRFHVSHVAVDAKPARDGGLKLRIGVDPGNGVIVQGTTVEVAAERVAEVTALFDEAKARRGS